MVLLPPEVPVLAVTWFEILELVLWYGRLIWLEG